MVPLIRSGVLVNLFQSGGDETMESSGSIFNVLEHSQRVGPENYVKGNIQHCPGGVAMTLAISSRWGMVGLLRGALRHFPNTREQ